MPLSKFFEIFFSKIDNFVIFQDIDLKIKPVDRNFPYLKRYAVSFSDFGLEIGLKWQKTPKIRFANSKIFDFFKTRPIDDVIIPPIVGVSTQFFLKLRISHKFLSENLKWISQS